MDLAVEAGLVTVQQMQHPRLAGEVTEGLRHGVPFVKGDGLAVIDGDIEDLGFDAANPHAPPIGCNDIIDQHTGDGVGGPEIVVEFGGELVEVLLGLLFEDDVFGEEAVFNLRFAALARDVRPFGARGLLTRGVCFAALARGVPGFASRGWMRLRRVWI